MCYLRDMHDLSDFEYVYTKDLITAGDIVFSQTEEKNLKSICSS